MPYPEIDPVFIGLGPFQIRWYALAYIAGIVLGWYYLTRLLQQPERWKGPSAVQTEPPINKTQLDDVLFFVTLGIILGGRLGFVLFYRPEMMWKPFSEWPRVFSSIPVWEPLAIWTGGMSFHGGLIGVALATLYFSRKHKINPFALGDLFACAAPIGLFFGRIANFINGELYGRPWDGPWAVKFPSYYDDQTDSWVYSQDAVPRHPSQLYEAFLEGIVLFILIRIAVTRFAVLRLPGMATGLFVAGYGLARFFVEFFREPDDYKFAGPLGFLTRGMMLSLPMVALGIWLVWRAWNQRKLAAA
ncbi:prolipoprotein diacylglyceryl transferase [Parvularcula marina]|uniref:prolipoprotein diacylglyceryl transferase n=1 Tax=Parvularcula marina TaxID=2292771 RepID=UPI0035170D3E